MKIFIFIILFIILVIIVSLAVVLDDLPGDMTSRCNFDDDEQHEKK